MEDMNFRVVWDSDLKLWVCTCDEKPGLECRGITRVKALQEMVFLLPMISG